MRKIASCSFCGRKINGLSVIRGQDKRGVYICFECVEVCALMVCAWRAEKNPSWNPNPTEKRNKT
jgi:hypothetical protein